HKTEQAKLGVGFMLAQDKLFGITKGNPSNTTYGTTQQAKLRVGFALYWIPPPGPRAKRVIPSIEQ
ncbi:hypothetical protein, partial [uncultured Altibacter sp.]|uniref:hypothetical protein n=1 Tax=uncultured Altibacter sp. TaxID=2506933 RepID=UPI0030DAA990